MIYSEEEIAELKGEKIPHHIAIIPDGNRRWAKSISLGIGKGHEKGTSLIMSTVLAAKALGIKAITFYGFSTENWKRSQEEVDILLWLSEMFLVQELPKMMEENVRFRTLGDLSRLTPHLRHVFENTKEATKDNTGIDFVIAMNYGARDEIVRAAKSLAEKVKEGTLLLDQIDETLFASHLDSHPLPDPDLLIRTSGENRISNFLLWQLSYAELYTVPLKWPEFTPRDLLQAVKTYQERERRQGL